MAVEASTERAVAELAGEIAGHASGAASTHALLMEGERLVARPDARLAELGYDSLACADLILAVEEHFGVKLVEADLNEQRTVADIAATVQRKMTGRPRVPPGIGRIQPAVKKAVARGFRWQSRLKVRGTEHVPMTGPAIVAANHRSMLDIPLLVIASPRPVVFMAKGELFADPIRRRLWHELGGFPVRREVSDVRAIDVGLAVLERGDLLALYPEGTRSRSGEMLPFLKGTAWIALRMGVPIVPCGISGTARRSDGRRTFRKDVTLAFGPPIEVDQERDPRARREKTEALTTRILEEITRLLV